VALFPDLCDLNDRLFAEPEAATQRDTLPVNAFGCNVFGKISESDIQTPRLTFLYSFYGKKTDLSFPGPGVGVTQDSVIDV
jgi:hypothetical protein